MRNNDSVPRVLYVVCTNDKYELPLYVCDSSTELGQYLGIHPQNIRSELLKSKNGEVICKNRKLKYFRIDFATGKTIVGKLPPDLAKLCTTRKNTG